MGAGMARGGGQAAQGSGPVGPASLLFQHEEPSSKKPLDRHMLEVVHVATAV